MKISLRILALAVIGLADSVTLGCGDPTAPTAPMTGTIEITVSTTSATADIDPDGYTVKVDDLAAHTVATEGTVMIPGFSLGKHFVRLDGLAPNCSVNGDNPRPAELVAPELVSLTSFAVECHPPTDSDPDPWGY